MELDSTMRIIESPLVEMLWRDRKEEAGSFTSAAFTNWELVFVTVKGETSIVVRGPENRASEADFPADAEYLGISFKLGTFMPHLPVKSLLNTGIVLPEASYNSFWLDGSTWERPTFDNADVFVQRMVQQGLLVQDSLVGAALAGETPDISLRSLQYRFLQPTGMPHKRIQQIERAHRAVSMLEKGTSILDTTFYLGYFDQAHLTNSLKDIIGRTPTQIIQQIAPK